VDRVRLLRGLGYLLVLQFAFGVAATAGREWGAGAGWAVVVAVCAVLALPFVYYRHGDSVRARRLLMGLARMAAGLSVLNNSVVLGYALGWPMGVLAFVVQLGLMAYYFYLTAGREAARPRARAPLASQAAP
jgi:phosphoglycerol transferase MdoB-like AlkP superfamily enzyme